MVETARLLIDAGNTRVKFARLDGDVLLRQRAVVHGGRVDARLSRLLATAARNVSAVHWVSVAGPRFDRRLIAAVQRHRIVPAVQFLSAAHCGAVRNAYVEPWRLGADRWAGLLGAWSLRRGVRPALVVSAGTALTVDLIDAGGRHRGGVIAAGADLMTQCLLGKTAGIAIRARGLSGVGSRPFGVNTAQALHSGALLAGVGLVERLYSDAAQLLKAKPRLLITGGGASALAKKLRLPVELVPDLNLRGLAFSLQRPTTTGAWRRSRA